MKLPRPALALLPLALLAPALAGCVGGSEETGTPDVVATFYPLAFVAERVAGEDLTVGTLVPGGVEPHEWEPTPDAVVAAGEARVVLANGAGLDPWIDGLLRESGSRAARLDAADVVSLIEDDEEHGEEEPEQGGPHVGKDPHFWLDPIALSSVARGVADTFARADPDNAHEYAARAAALVGELHVLHAEYEAGLASCSNRQVLTTHSAFGYLAARYNFTQHSVSGISPDEEPSAGRLRDIVDLARRENITVVFHERLVSPRLATAIAGELEGGRTLPLDPIEGIPASERAAGGDYFSLARQNLANLRIAMGCA